MKNLKRTIATFVAMVLLLTNIPLTVFAAGGNITSATVNRSSRELSSSGGEAIITLRGESLSPENIRVKVMLNNERQEQIEKSLATENDMGPTRVIMKLTFPQNTTNTDLTYQLSFNATGSNEAFQDEIPSSVVVRKSDGISGPTEAIIESINAFPITNDSYDKNFVSVHFLITGKNLDPKKMKAKVMQGDQIQENIQNTIQSVALEKQISSSLRFPLNNTDTPQVYKVYFNADGSDKFDDKNAVEISIQKKDTDDSSDPGVTPPPPSNNDKIKAIEGDFHSLPSNGSIVKFGLITFKEVLSEQIKVLVLLDGKTVDTPLLINVAGDGARRNVSVEVPKNKTDKEQIYTLKFNGTGSTTDFQEQPIVTIKVAPQDNAAPTINELRVLTPHLPKEGGETKITVKGFNLTDKNLFVKIWKIVGDQKIEQPSITKDIVFYGTSKVRTATITFPAMGNASDKYLIRVGTSADHLTHEGKVTVGENSSGELIVLQPTSTYINSQGNLITLRFDEPIFAVKNIMDVKDGISLDLDGDTVFEKLQSENTVEIADSAEIKNNLLLIKLHQKIDTDSIKSQSKIRLKERILKDSKNREGERAEFFIQKAPAKIFMAEFLEGEKLDHNGGKVRLKFIGENLLKQVGDKELKPIVQVVELQAKSSEQHEIKNIINEKSTDTEQVFSFDLPQNDSPKATSYMIRVSLDEGRTFSSSIGVNMYDRSKRLISTVFPKGADMNAPILSFISIQSYGTLGGGKEEPNRTHTDVPVLQESKKTLAYIYGANLKKELTKIKIVDQNGVEWTPVNHSSFDSADQFIMINLDGTGLEGNGNNQLAEIICPNNIAGDQIFKYIIAVDGKNFDQEVFVTAKVLDDKLPGKKRSLEPDQIKEFLISYVSEEDQQIAPTATTKGYIWNKTVSYNAKPIDIEGYKVKGFYSIKKSDDGNIKKSELSDLSVLNDKVTVGDIDEIRFVYTKTTSDNHLDTSSQGSSSSRASVRPDPVGKKSESISDNKTPLATPQGSFELKLQANSSKLIKIVDGKESSMSISSRLLIQNKTPMVPIRSIAEALGLKIKWNAAQKTILLSDGQNEFQIILNPSKANMDENTAQGKQLSMIINSRAYISIEQLQNVFGTTKGYLVQWNDARQELTIKR